VRCNDLNIKRPLLALQFSKSLKTVFSRQN